MAISQIEDTELFDVSEVLQICSDDSFWNSRKNWWTFEMPTELSNEFLNNQSYELKLKGINESSLISCCSRGETYSLSIEKSDAKYYFLMQLQDQTSNENVSGNNQLKKSCQVIDDMCVQKQIPQCLYPYCSVKDFVCLVGESQQSYCLNRMAPQLHQVLEFFANSKKLYWHLVDILAATQASEMELMLFLIEGFFLCLPNVPTTNDDTIEIPLSSMITNSHENRCRKGFWQAVTLTDIYNSMRLFLSQIVADRVPLTSVTLQTVTRLLQKAVSQSQHMFSFPLELTDVVVIQLARYFATIHPVGPAANYIGDTSDDLWVSTKFDTYLEMLRLLQKHDNTDCELLSNIVLSNEMYITIDPTKVLRIVQLFILEQSHHIRLTEFGKICTDLYYQITPAELYDPFPYDLRTEQLQNDLFARAGMFCLCMEELPKDATDGSFDAYSGFANLRNLQGDPSQYGILMLSLIAGFGHVNSSEGELYIKWLPHYTLPWNWLERTKQLLSMQSEWYEEDLSVYLRPTLSYRSAQTTESILAANFTRLTSTPPYLLYNTRIQLDA